MTGNDTLAANDEGPMTDGPEEVETGPIIFSDFDGTISLADVTDQILERLADPSWHDVEERWVRGEIGSRECLGEQMALVQTEVETLRELIDSVPLDPGFVDFYGLVQARQIPFYVLSDGFDYVIRRVLRRSGATGPLRNGSHLFSSSLKPEAGRLMTSFPHPAAGCEHGCATCKPAIMRRLGRSHQPVIYIGDGLSDRFAVGEASLVFAKNKLLDFCRSHSIPCEPFETFGDVSVVIEKLLYRPAQNGKTATAERRLRARPEQAEVAT